MVLQCGKKESALVSVRVRALWTVSQDDWLVDLVEEKEQRSLEAHHQLRFLPLCRD